jgi:hypothetical protein
MELRNVTVSLPADLLQEARHLAADRGLSLSEYLALLVEERIDAARRYRTARERQLSLLKKGIPVGTAGRIPWSREALHER